MATRVVAQGRRSCCHGRSAVHEPVSVESRTGLYGTFMAYDNTSLEPLWKINVGAGINSFDHLVGGGQQRFRGGGGTTPFRWGFSLR